MLQANDFVIDDANYQERCFVQEVDGHPVSFGLIPRNYNANPVGSYDGSTTFNKLNDELPLIPYTEMPDRIAAKIAAKSQLSDIRNVGNNGNQIPSLDQNGQGYCWFYSGTGAVTLLRAVANMPYVRLSAHAGACKIKNFRDQGGWGAAGLDFLRSTGVPSVKYWAEKSMSRQYDTAETWANAALHKVCEGFIDLDASQYDRRLSFQQVLTCLLCNIPVIGDFNWWGHSVCLMDAVDVYPNKPASDPGRYGVRIINSWTDNWGTKGTSVLTGSKAVPDGSTAPRAVVLSEA